MAGLRDQVQGGRRIALPGGDKAQTSSREALPARIAQLHCQGMCVLKGACGSVDPAFDEIDIREQRFGQWDERTPAQRTRSKQPLGEALACQPEILA
jgi:hypothetical protein